VRVGVREVLAGHFEVQESASCEEAVDFVRDIGRVDVAILDLSRRSGQLDGSLSGPAAIRALRRAAPGLGIVAHGEPAERHAATAALQAGASAYVSRAAGAEAMRRAARSALQHERFVDPAVPPKGRAKLTRRQRQILQLLADGESTTVAARELGLSEETVKTHAKHALARLGARNRTHAVAIALRESLIE
jgi:two-component system NarL family response regulator